MAVEKIAAENPVEKLPQTAKPEKTPELKHGLLENIAERILSRPEKAKETIKSQAEKIATPIVPISSAVPTWQQKRMEAIDNILAEGLNEVFLKMNPNQQKEFKKKGEEITLKINELLNKTKVNVRKIIDLIKSWLKMIPGVNSFFLEQEVKIKADKILKIKDKF